MNKKFFSADSVSNKKTFQAPELEIIKFDLVNVIATSGESYTNEEVKEKDLDQFDIKF